MKKSITLVFLAMLLVFPYPIGKADRNVGSNQSTVEANSVGEVASKDEVVYGTLSATGDLNEIYVVNMLDVTKPGVVIDHGDYSSVTNLTNLLEMEQVAGTVQFQASPGWFFYQGNMELAELPWDVNISYMLDGKEISPEDLPGKEGHLHITIKTSKNENVDPLFYENYTMQISLTLDTDIISNIQAPDATMVNVGKKRQVNYTLMPEAEGDISLLADVVDFEMEGIDFFAIPLSMAFDDLEIDTSEMRTLSDAIGELNSGVSDLKTGVSELNDGVQRLNTGSIEYKSGMMELKDSSSKITNASGTIGEALTVISRELSGSSEMDLSGLAQLPEGLTLIAGGLGEVANGLTLLNENFTMAYSALDDSMKNIPAPAVTEEEIQELYVSGANHKTIDYLLEVYAAAQTAKGTYDQVKEAFTAVETALAGASGAVYDISNQLTYIAGELSGAFEAMEGLDALNELQEGIALLAGNYAEFHSGLVSYTEGVSMLADAYNEIDSGFNKVAKGTSELVSGVGELQAGTKELADATNDLPDKMQEEIDAIMDEFDKSDFEAISFVSPKNTNVNLVQFILKTEAIELVDDATVAEEEEEKPGFWQRLLDLFF
ncbi:YhgE/Pip domain-containing protein [Anaerobacillus sp. CMMVII]|uniref:YhgE/Pip domain-containing protein n=1 Tax=Anaerobacillus sp. CMMVII TaxID=2755588 RepID=UPI0021B732E4|nr:YhgE/Pip domain-containing protein [Anaerobacillus sp. CMMVII]MCT8136982.1 YhgE/Pip domain-containing protein [Anaerobacillus sp. CMMVII]